MLRFIGGDLTWVMDWGGVGVGGADKAGSYYWFVGGIMLRFIGGDLTWVMDWGGVGVGGADKAGSYYWFVGGSMLRFIGGDLTWVTEEGIVPPRDLTAEEVERWGGVEALLESGLYVEAEVEAEEEDDGSQ